MPTDAENARKVLWAVGGPRTRCIAHAYLNESAYQAGSCLCGRTTKPYLPLPMMDLDDPNMAAMACPVCRQRLKILNFFNPEKL